MPEQLLTCSYVIGSKKPSKGWNHGKLWMKWWCITLQYQYVICSKYTLLAKQLLWNAASWTPGSDGRLNYYYLIKSHNVLHSGSINIISCVQCLCSPSLYLIIPNLIVVVRSVTEALSECYSWTTATLYMMQNPSVVEIMHVDNTIWLWLWLNHWNHNSC